MEACRDRSLFRELERVKGDFGYADLFHWTPEHASAVSPFPWAPERARLCKPGGPRHPEVVGLCPKE